MDALIEKYNKYKYQPLGLLIGTILILMFLFQFDLFLEKGIQAYYVRWMIYFFIMVIWIIIWYLMRVHFPKNGKNKIGIIISITTENNKQKIRIINDFIRGMNDIAIRNNYGDLINIVCIEGYKATKANDILTNHALSYIKAVESNSIPEYVNSKTYLLFKRFLKTTKAHLYIYGAMKERQDEENKYYLSIDACVIHKPIDINFSNNISKDFREMFPKEISFYEKLESKGFQITSDIVFDAARYMIGVAALISYDPFTAYKIHKGLHSDLQKLNPKPLNIKHISDKLNSIISDELLQQSRYHYFVNKNPDLAKQLLEEAESIYSENYNVFIFRSYYTFEVENDPRKSLEYCNQAKKYANGNGTWLYNQAFLYMYLEDFMNGFETYEIIKESYFTDEALTLDQCISFNEEYFTKYPAFYQSLFILGYLYYYKKNNLPLALEKFEMFINKANKKYKYLKDKAISFVINIKKEMEL